MTQGKALQSEAGNLTVLTYGKSGLMIWVDARSDIRHGDEVCYITDNPCVSDRAIDFEFDEMSTHDGIKALIDLAFHTKKIEDLAKRVALQNKTNQP